jgi:hypothetical protein
MPSRRQCQTIALIALVTWLPSLVTAASRDLLHLVLSRVRIQSPQLGPGWHEGLFNRERREPPCYVILTHDPRPSSDSPLRGRVIPLRGVSRLEVYTGPISSIQEWAGRQSPDLQQDSLWQPIPPDVLEANRHCS